MSRSGKNLYTVLKTLLGERPGSALSNEPRELYREYLEANSPTPEILAQQRQAAVNGLPIFAVAIVGEGAKQEDIKRTKDSLAAQTYSRWEFTENPKAGEWQFIMYMWPGDTLAPHALYEYAMAAEGHDLLYCDEDMLGAEGRERPAFKTAPDMITELSYDMLRSGVAVSRALHTAVGGMIGESADDRYGYNLRCLKNAASPHHIPKVLYTCGKYREVTPAARCHVEKAADRDCYVMPGEWRGSFRVDAVVKKPGVAVIINNRDSYQPLLRLLMSIDGAAEQKATIYIADRGSTDSRTLRYYDILKRNGAAKVYYGGDSGIPALFNAAAAEADADVAVFMESTVEILSHNWIGELLSQAMRSGVGAAGPKLLSSDGRLLHCGTVIGMHGWRGSPYQGSEDDRGDERKRTFTNTTRRVSALSAACMMVRMETFFNVGCFDESFCFTGFDTEFCLRMAGRGYASVYAPRALVKSYVPIASIQDAEEQDIQRCYDAMRDTLAKGDPYYNINYDYGASKPIVAVNPAPPIMLNPIYTKK